LYLKKMPSGIYFADYMKGSSKIRHILSLFFVICICAALLFFYSLPIRGQKDISEEEQRTLQHVPPFSLEGFLSGKYQKQAEDAVADQMLFSAEIKYGVKQIQNNLTNATAELVQTGKNNASSNKLDNENPEEAVKIQPHYTYTEVVADKVYKLDNSGYLVQKSVPPDQFLYTIYDPDMLKRVTFPKYLYFINTSVSVDFNDMNKYDAFDYVKKVFPMTGYAELTFSSFEEYKKYFYQTDHHWNYNGSYKGYTQIMRMMEGDSVILLKPLSIHIYDVIYNGSLSRDSLLKYSNEKFTVFNFAVPEYETYINDKRATYGRRSRYVSSTECPNNTYSNHYGLYYGDDYAKVVYKFNNPNAGNILILATSFSNAINDLIASHYNETHVLDYRHYPQMYGEKIDAQSYMEKNHLTKLLIIGDLPSLGFQRKKK
jgi:hypothetical protein